MSDSHQNQPLKIMFLTTSMPVGGAETLLVNLVRGLDSQKFSAEIACLKQRGPLGDLLAEDFPVHANLLSHKFDLRVLPRLVRLLKTREADAIVTVGAGDKMFWGRIAAKLAGVPVIASALHSTGWPDSVGKLNRLLTPITDAFIGVADAHAEHLVHYERFPENKVHTIYNGVDTERFRPGCGRTIRKQLGIPLEANVVGILAALRPEKNHELFLTGAKEISDLVPNTHFLIVGDGPRRADLEKLAGELDISEITHFVGSRDDIPQLLRAMDLMTLTSHNEASPVSILEALSTGIPVVASRVGSIPETVLPGETGFLFPPNDTTAYVEAVVHLLQNKSILAELGANGRKQVISQRSLQVMVDGYENLIGQLFELKAKSQPTLANSTPQISQNFEYTP